MVRVAALSTLMSRRARVGRVASTLLLVATGCFGSRGGTDDGSAGVETAPELDEAEDRVFELYFDSYARPAQFDAQLADTRASYDTPAVHACLAEIGERMVEPATSHRETCDTHVDPQWRNDCLNENDPANVLLWTVNMRDVLNGTLPWASTDQGQAAVLAQELTDATLGAGAWEELYEDASARYEDVIRIYLDCT